MKLVCISDTHQSHKGVTIPPCDILVCSGDVTIRGHKHEVISFLNWFTTQPAKHKVFIAGNHDFIFQEQPEVIKKLVEGYDVIYLEESSVTLMGYKIYGTPWTPEFHAWAFNGDEQQCRLTASLIPLDTDILLSHGPPADILDSVLRPPGKRVGCYYMRERLREVKPLVHAFGHIHEDYGVHVEDGTVFVNASSCNLRYEPINYPVVFKLEGRIVTEL
jgi:Icc-related predicted phosphoesterase